MKVYAPLFAVVEHEPSRAVIETYPIAQRCEQGNSRVRLIQLNDGIKIVMRPGLCTDQGVNSPATVEPDLDSGIGQAAND